MIMRILLCKRRNLGRCRSEISPRGDGASRPPVPSGISKRVYRHISQSCCPWNVEFSQELAEDSPFRARAFIAGKDAVTLASDILALDQDAFSAAFRKSPVKRAKLAGLRRNAAVTLANARPTAKPEQDA